MSGIALRAGLAAVACTLVAALAACGSEEGDPSEEGRTVSRLEIRSGPRVRAAAAEYGGYVRRTSGNLVARTKWLVGAVVAGDVAKAKTAYAAARVPYEQIQPVAEYFGDLGPRIDARENDVSPSEFGGFHRIERALWEKRTAASVAPVARQLLADVEELRRRAGAVRLQTTRIADVANELLGEVSALKVTGEEERHSDADLLSLEAGVAGAEAAVAAVGPLLRASDPTLAREIELGFQNVYAALAPHRRGGGFVPYEELSRNDTRQLAQAVHVLAEEVAAVPAAVAGGG